MNSSEIMTIEEVAKLLRVSERTIYDWAQKGVIPAGKLGSSWRFKREEVNRWIDNRLSTTPRNTSSSLELKSILTPDRVAIFNCSNKKQALEMMINLLASSGRIKKQEKLRQGIFHREELMSTGIGYGVGIPHVRLPSVSGVVMAMGVNKKDILDYTSLDSTPVRIICMMAAGENQHAGYLQTLALLGARLKQPGIRDRILSAQTTNLIYSVITDEANR